MDLKTSVLCTQYTISVYKHCTKIHLVFTSIINANIKMHMNSCSMKYDFYNEIMSSYSFNVIYKLCPNQKTMTFSNL